MPTSIRLPDDAEKRLAALALKIDRSKAFYIREALMEHLDNLEDIYLSEKIIERVRRGEERTYTLAEVEKELSLPE